MKKIRLDISYIGTSYCGWQVQPNGMSVQQKLQDCIEKLYGKRYAVTGCSRTDSGVHAKQFVCTVELSEDADNIPSDKLPLVLNKILPDDIAVLCAAEVPDDFHPRYSSQGKEYEYHYYDSPLRDPFLHGRVTYVFPRLDVECMDRAAKHFIGKHDFAAFMASGSKIIDTERTVYDCSVSRAGNEVVLRISADGFLYNMVRIIAGTLADVGRGRIGEDDIEMIITSKQRSLAGQTLAPEGLYLSKVFYRKRKE